MGRVSKFIHATDQAKVAAIRYAPRMARRLYVHANMDIPLKKTVNLVISCTLVTGNCLGMEDVNTYARKEVTKLHALVNWAICYPKMVKVVTRFTLVIGNTDKFATKFATKRETSTLALAVKALNLLAMVRRAFQFILVKLKTTVGVNIYVTSMEQVQGALATKDGC